MGPTFVHVDPGFFGPCYPRRFDPLLSPSRFYLCYPAASTLFEPSPHRSLLLRWFDSVVLKGSAETPFLMFEVNCHRDVGFQRYAYFLSFLEAYNEALCSASLVYRPDASYNISFLSRGDVTESSTAVKRNHGKPPFDSCAKMPLPFTSSTATADVNPTIASRPLIRSGADPLNEFGAHLERSQYITSS
uniref:Uncharacterized protein n=1 Tax=Ananas comosus var. bracteatus TaxID=296719 RepID=A0A6V7PSG7_ANACO|nr:unnamed protein product [Ananas comosus var. bracteatus]